jgi:hypothetical protein
MPRSAILLAVLALLTAAAVFAGLPGTPRALAAQGAFAFRESEDHPAIGYSTAAVDDAVAVLNRRIETGAAHLTFDRDNGYLPSVLQALHVPKESQMAVFSATSFQADKINAQNPRAIFFNDSIAVGWVRGGLLEVAAQDPRLGPVFYTLEQRAAARPQFKRSAECLECHRSWETLAVPGLMVLTTFPPTTKNGYASGGATDHRTPLARRWASWYVTGKPGANRHMGNKLIPTERDASAPVVLASLEGRFDLRGYPTPYSDIAALMVFEHQTHMTNLLTYIDWESRVAEFTRHAGGAASAPAPVSSNTASLAEIAHELVDYMLFVDEAPLAGRIEGSSGFAQMFSAEGPSDSRGRSLRQLDLERRLMRYPCSYMIYSPLFEALPIAAKDAIYGRLWHVLSGADKDAPYARLSYPDRRDIVDILRETKKDLPAYFQPVRS